MPIAIITQKVYETSDGKTFLEITDAREYERKLAITTILDRDGVCRGGSWDQEMILDWLLKALPEINQTTSGRLFKKKST